MADFLFCISNRNKILPTCTFLTCRCPWMSKNLKICSNPSDKLFLQGSCVIPVVPAVVLALPGKRAAVSLGTLVALLSHSRKWKMARNRTFEPGSWKSVVLRTWVTRVTLHMRFSKLWEVLGSPNRALWSTRWLMAGTITRTVALDTWSWQLDS